MADIFLPDGAYLHLEHDRAAGLGWWRVDGKTQSRLTVSQALEQAPGAVCQEVVFEAQELAHHSYKDYLRAGAYDLPWHAAITSLWAEIATAADHPRLKELGDTPVRHLVS